MAIDPTDGTNGLQNGGRFDRITFDSQIMGGRACVRGMRITVSVIMGHIAHGAGFEEVLNEREDIEQALHALEQPMPFSEHAALGQGLGHFGDDDGEYHRGQAGDGRAGERIDALQVQPGDHVMQHTGGKPGRVEQLGVQHQKADKAADQAGVGPRSG